MLLYGLIDVEEVAIRRPRNENPRINSASFKYHLLIGTSRHIVCLNAFVNAFGVTTKRVRRIRELKKACKTPEDKRGKVVSFSMSDEIKSLVREHISSFPMKESHYLGGTKFYLNAELNLKIMYNLFCEKYPEKKVSYSFYYTFFKDNFNLRFGRSQVDTCEEIKLKIKSPHLNEAAKRSAVAELLVYKRRSQKFYSALKYEASEDAKEENNILFNCIFNYMQNISLPKVPVQELFYLRQQ
ncbi:uncharacterized protein LOC124374058 [Homalodisca vitripennis]|uniref:uncharacterized protein LOC124374058 n=1 Tax=Homalodisca vitripennis TaxID=197043 RepID=UPI001EECD4D9|nr:uncharacterized protein LOC124374058 [Homalodisca vitripennis]